MRIPVKVSAVFASACVVLFSSVSAGLAQSGPINTLFEELQRRNAQGTMAVLGFVGIPDNSASAIYLQSSDGAEDSYDFRSAQLGGGFKISEDFPLYLEGYIGYGRYDPVLILGDQGNTSELPLKWTGVAATGGIGWEFDLNEYWYFRPQAHISIGRTQSDASVGAQFIANNLGLDFNYLESGGLWSTGFGGSAAIGYQRRFESDRELELQLRYTHLIYQPYNQEDLSVESDASNAVLWARYRWPTGKVLFNRPVRWVVDGSYSYLIGDQSEVIGSDWLAKVGVGGEIDLDETWVPWVTTTRFMVRYYGSDTVTGFTAGIGFSF